MKSVADGEHSMNKTQRQEAQDVSREQGAHFGQSLSCTRGITEVTP